MKPVPFVKAAQNTQCQESCSNLDSAMVAGNGESSRRTLTMLMSGSRPNSSFSQRVKKTRRFCGKVREINILGAQKAIDKKKKYRRRQKKLGVFDLTALSDCLPKLEFPGQPSTCIQQVARMSKKKLLPYKGIQDWNSVYHAALLQPDTMAFIHPLLENSHCASLRSLESNFFRRKWKRMTFKKSIVSVSLSHAMEC